MTSDPQPVTRPPALAPTIVLPYGDEPGQTVDVWLPREPRTRKNRPSPWIVVIPGGFWTTADGARQAYPMAAALATSGFPTAVIGYRRVGESGGGWPGTLDDVARAVRMVPDLVRQAIRSAATPAPALRSAERGLVEEGLADPDRPILLGYAGGGYLALWAARRAPVRAVLALAPVADLAAAYHANVGSGAVSALLGGRPDEVPDRYVAADPATALPMGVPVAIIHGVDDDVVPVALSRKFATSARRAGDGVTLRELPQAGHGSLIDPDSAAWPAVLAALDALA